MKKVVFVLVLLLLGVSRAFDIEVPAEPVIITIGESTSVDIKLSSSISELVLVSIVDQKPWMLLENSQLTLNESKKATLIISPRGDLALGLYKIRVSVLSLDTEEKKFADIYLSLKRGAGLSIDKTLVAGNLEPTGTVILKADLKNYGRSAYQDIEMNVTVKSPLRKVAYSLDLVSVGPEETITIEKVFQLDKNAEAGEYVAEVFLSQNGKPLDSTAQRFIVAQKAIISQDIRYSSMGLGYEKTVRIKNDGNIAGSAVFTQLLAPVETLFFVGDKPSSTVDNVYSWEVRNLQPASEVTIRYRIDYSPFVIGVIVFVGIIGLYIYKFNTVRLRKYIMQKKFIEEGEEFTVGIDVKNASGKTVAGITVKDFVPSVFDVKEGEGPKPLKHKSGSGTELTWRLDKLRNGEERLVSYRIVPVIGVHGTIALPRAAVDFIIGSKERASYSGHAFMGIDVKQLPGLEKVFKKKRKGLF